MSPTLARTLLTAILLITSLATVQARADDEETLERVVESGTLVVGMSGDQPPMNALNREGNFMGFDVDLARALAGAMRVSLEIEQMPFGDLMEALDEGDVDLVISGMAITPERAMEARFAGPYMLSGKSILTRGDVVEQFATGELANKQVRLAALRNSTSAIFVREAAPNSELVEVADYASAIAMIQAGDVAGLVADMPTCILAVLRHPDADLVTLDEPLTVEPLGIAVSDDDPAFHSLVNNYLDAYERTGLLQALRVQWMENSSWVAALP
jgi:ABC-type amino acid transport substrate-binding protein